MANLDLLDRQKLEHRIEELTGDALQRFKRSMQETVADARQASEAIQSLTAIKAGQKLTVGQDATILFAEYVQDDRADIYGNKKRSIGFSVGADQRDLFRNGWERVELGSGKYCVTVVIERVGDYSEPQS